MRQLWDSKGSAIVESMEPTTMDVYAQALRPDARPGARPLRRPGRDLELPGHERRLRPGAGDVRRGVRRPERARLRGAEGRRRLRTDHGPDRALSLRPSPSCFGRLLGDDLLAAPALCLLGTPAQADRLEPSRRRAAFRACGHRRIVARSARARNVPFLDPSRKAKRPLSRPLRLSSDGRQRPTIYSIGISKRAMMPGSPPLARSSGSGSRVATQAYPCSG